MELNLQRCENTWKEGQFVTFCGLAWAVTFRVDVDKKFNSIILLCLLLRRFIVKQVEKSPPHLC
jgi:hypothetical protein